jgi:hypothetical protein
MRFSVKSIVVAALTVLVVSGCQPDENDPFDEDKKPDPVAFTFKAKLNGADWVGTQNLTLLVKNSTGLPAKEMRISANAANGKLLTLTLKDQSTGMAGDGIPVKTYILNNGNGDAQFALVNTASGADHNGTYGNVTITSNDIPLKKISGTFSCTLAQGAGDTIKVTNGVFTDLPYEISEQ